MRSLEVRELGRIAYADAWELQKSLEAQRKLGEIGDQLLLLEHPHVLTLGRNGHPENVLVSRDRLEQLGIQFFENNRGGDITYHGPGQVVGYPIVSLDAHRDLHAYLRFLEQVVINTLGKLGLAASRRPGKTGIWLADRKIAAIGVAVRRWVTYHGFALNVNPDLAPFGGIVPCGIAASEGKVTSMAAELPRCPPLAEVKAVLADEFWTGFPVFLAAGQKVAAFPQ